MQVLQKAPSRLVHCGRKTHTSVSAKACSSNMHHTVSLQLHKRQTRLRVDFNDIYVYYKLLQERLHEYKNKIRKINGYRKMNGWINNYLQLTLEENINIIISLLIDFFKECYFHTVTTRVSEYLPHNCWILVIFYDGLFFLLLNCDHFPAICRHGARLYERWSEGWAIPHFW